MSRNSKISGPSVKRMTQAFELSKIRPCQIKVLKMLMDGKIQSRRICAVLGIQHHHLTRVQRILAIADKWLGNFGVEITRSTQDTHREFLGLEYSNTGDSYCPTIIYDYRGSRFMCASWGDIVERFPNRYQ